MFGEIESSHCSWIASAVFWSIVQRRTDTISRGMSNIIFSPGEMLSCNNKCNNRRVYIGKILLSPAWNSDYERPDTLLEQMEYMIIDGIVYYISQFDEGPEVKLYIGTGKIP